MMARISPFADVERHVAQGFHPAEAEGNPVDREQRVAPC
jgi:hypothetical protein